MKDKEREKLVAAEEVAYKACVVAYKACVVADEASVEADKACVVAYEVCVVAGKALRDYDEKKNAEGREDEVIAETIVPAERET